MRPVVDALALGIGYLVLGSSALLLLTALVWLWRSWLAQPWPRRTRTVVVERNGPWLNPHPLRNHPTVHVEAASADAAWVAIGEDRTRRRA